MIRFIAKARGRRDVWGELEGIDLDLGHESINALLPPKRSAVLRPKSAADHLALLRPGTCRVKIRAEYDNYTIQVGLGPPRWNPELRRIEAEVRESVGKRQDFYFFV